MTQKFKSLIELKAHNKTVIVRCNLDGELKSEEEINNSYRIKSIIPTIKYLSDNNCKVIILTHLGNPEGNYVDELSLMPVRFELGRLLEKQVKFANIAQCENSIKFMEFGDILLLENLAFSKDEMSSQSKDRKNFIKKLAGISDIYVNEAFGVFDKYASLYELPSLIEDRYVGFAFEEEYNKLTNLKNNHPAPYVAIIGGEYSDEKIKDLEILTKDLDKILFGGEIAYAIHQGVIEKNGNKNIKSFLKTAKLNKTKIVLPIDYIVEDKNKAKKQINSENIPEGLIGMDIGPKTIELFKKEFEDAKTIIIYGPMGNFYNKEYSTGTFEIYQAVTNTPIETVKVANGDSTVKAIINLKIKIKRFNHVSNSDRMMLKFLNNNRFEVLSKLA